MNECSICIIGGILTPICIISYILKLLSEMESKQNLIFRNLTMAPIDIDLINFKMLTKKERNYLFNYPKEKYISEKYACAYFIFHCPYQNIQLNQLNRTLKL